MIFDHNIYNMDETHTIEQKMYKSMIGGQQYLTHIKLDIENTIGIVARFQVDPKESHYIVVERIFKYLKFTSNYGFWYDRSSDFTLYTYTDADYEGNMDERKRTSGGAFFSWRNIGFLVEQEALFYFIEYNLSRVCGNKK